MEESEKKKIYTEKERLELAAKLDKDLDDFINNLPKTRYEDGWPKDRWEEMDKHPFFMKKAPEPGEEMHPLYEGLQKLKYDPEENEPEELAVAYKDDGNFNFKHKNYRLAIISYTEGIKIKCGKPEIEANLLNNRAAAHYFLKNYRSSLRDSELALKIQPDYMKAISRAANCCAEMKMYEKAIEYCDVFLNINKEDKSMIELRQKCVSAGKMQMRDKRKEENAQKRKNDENDKLIEVIRKKGVKNEGGVTLEKLEPVFPQLMQHRVHFDENQHLVWPVVFLYPEYKTMDYIQGFNEKIKLINMFETVFSEVSEWDIEEKYKPELINVYYETLANKIVKIPTDITLEEILSRNDFIVRCGTPCLRLLVKDSPAEKTFLMNN